MTGIDKVSKTLKAKITSKKAKIAVIGLGYVGLPLAVTFSERGYSVIGVDIDEKLAAKYPYQPAYLPVARREDGTLWDW